MNKKSFFVCIGILLLSTKVGYAEVDYRVYSKEYNECMAQNERTGNYEQCYHREYIATKKEVVSLLKKIQLEPEFQNINRSGAALIKTASIMNKYNELFCEYILSASKKERSLKECQLEQMNFLYVDLYKLYNELQSKKQRRIKESPSIVN